MSFKYQAFPGMEDILPGEVEKWQWVEEKARSLFSAKRFREIRTPLLEPTELFSRAIGETTDIVHKEMYTFQDRGERYMTLRPEMTASVARAVAEHGLLKTSPNLALFYIGPMFRAERPQAGRKRQFHQIGAELVNVPDRDPSQGAQGGDLTILLLINAFLRSVGISRLKFRINDLSLINGENGAQVRARIRDYFESHKAKLDPDSLYRLDKNVLRIFDSKVPATKALADALPWNDVAPPSGHFLELIGKLSDAGMTVEQDPKLVRGLDYYTGVVFEAASASLGAQDALAGGGRYDRLYAEIGAPSVPCTGFSIGMERLLMVLEKNTPSLTEQMKDCRVYLIPIGEGPGSPEAAYLEEAALSLRGLGFLPEMAKPSLKLGDQLKRAAKAEVRYVVMAGEKELREGLYQVKNMDLNEQKEVKRGELFYHLTQQQGKTLV